MNPTELADATARALDLLPEGDPARSDPRHVRDTILTEEARLTKEAAAAVWLAVSPLRVAPPEVLQSVLANIHPADSQIHHRSRFRVFWLAASGWAAAAVIAILLWPKSARVEPVSKPPDSSSDWKGNDVAGSIPPAPSPLPDIHVRKEILKLQERLAKLRKNPANLSPEVISLAVPGGGRRTPEEARQRVHSILTNALRSALEIESGAPGDAASLVIERGWVPGGLPVLQEGEVIRHRNFPESDWQDLGLSRSEDGSFYDVLSQTLWFPDPNGRGFIGRKVSAEDDLVKFVREPANRPTEPETLPMPEGFIVENPSDGTTDILVENVPTPAPGGHLVAQTTTAAGVIHEIPLTISASGTFPFGSIVSTSVGTAGATFSGNVVGSMNGGSVILNFPSSTIPAGFQLVERGVNPSGQPDKVIVTSEP